MTRLEISRLVEVEHRTDDPDETRFLPTLAAWFTSPYLGLPPAPTAALVGARSATGPTRPVAGRVVRPALADRIRALAGPDTVSGPPVALVDRHLEGRFGGLERADVRSAAATVRADRPASVVLVFDDGTEATAAPSDLVAALVAEVLVGPSPAAVGDGLGGELRRFRSGPGPARRTGVVALLPFPAGRAERAALVDAEAVAVGVGGYPALGLLVPEVAAVTAPVVGPAAAFTTAGPTTGTLAAARPGDRLALRLGPFRQAPARATARGGRRVAARTLRTVKRLTLRRATDGVLGRIGIDPDTRLGIVARLDPPLTTNPWLTAADWRILDPAPGHAVVRVEPVR